MGFKRSFDSEEFQEVPFKQARQDDYIHELTFFAESVPGNDAPKKLDVSGYNDESFHKPHWHDTFYNGDTEIPNYADEDENSVPLSLVTSSLSDDDVGSRGMAFSSHSPGYVGCKFPWRTTVPYEESSYMDEFPRKQVPLGPDHQASIPLWDGQREKRMLSSADSFNLDSPGSLYDTRGASGERFLGTCISIILESGSAEDDSMGAGGSSIDCGCLDEGSIRCARQHIMEARENVITSLGHEKFKDLGFNDMGEVVACGWTAEEERIFHAVVYSNPASLGQNFWMHLAQVFPSRSSKEIVSYYFNVFILRRRAMQNRSTLLDIDSDDDEVHVVSRDSHKYQLSADEDSDVESLVDQTDERKYPLEDEDDDSDDGSETDDGCNGADGSDTDDGCNGGDVWVDSGEGSVDATREDSGVDHVSEVQEWNSLDGSGFNPADAHFAQKMRCAAGDFPVQDDSCMSFEFQADKFDTCGPADTGSALLMNGVKSGHHSHSNRTPGTGRVEGCGDLVYLLDSCDAKVWDTRHSSKGFDFLPTSNIIEEIFGRGSCDDKTVVK